MPAAAIAVDNWKLPTFKRHLKAAGYQVENTSALGPDATLLNVAFEDLEGLAEVVKAANTEAARKRAH